KKGAGGRGCARRLGAEGVKLAMKRATRTPAMVLLGLGLAVGLLVVALGNAGTNTVLFQAVEGPNTPRPGQPGLPIAKFEPTKSSAPAPHPVTPFPFQSRGASTTPAPALAPRSVGAPPPADPLTIVCAVGTVNPGQLVKRFVTFTAGTAGQAGNVTMSVTFDA